MILFGEKTYFYCFSYKKKFRGKDKFSNLPFFVGKIKLTIFFAQLEALDFIHLIQVNK
jgi:hypothetical protein